MESLRDVLANGTSCCCHVMDNETLGFSYGVGHGEIDSFPLAASLTLYMVDAL